jgi:hypothetical protein
VKVARDGTIEVGADIVGQARWGSEADSQTNGFADTVDCVAPSARCFLGPAGSLAAKTPPETCTLHIADASNDTCAVWVRGCTPGARVTAAHEAAIGTAQPLLAVSELVDGGATLRLTGVDLQVIDGSGQTYSADSISGNLNLGYRPGLGTIGSHNLAIYNRGLGVQVADSSGGVIGACGQANLTGPSYNAERVYGSSMLGGDYNGSSASYSVILAGQNNESPGSHSLTAGGVHVGGMGYRATAIGGRHNFANADPSPNPVVLFIGESGATFGGDSNATGDLLDPTRQHGVDGVVIGGQANRAAGDAATVLGGANNVVADDYGFKP